MELKLESDVPADPVKIVQDFSDWLYEYSRTLSTFIELPRDCLEIMEKWGTEPEVPGERFPEFKGSFDADVFIVDSEGTFFEGKPGNLLVKILKAMHLDPASVFICRPCSAQALENAVTRVGPDIIIALGKRAANCVLGNRSSVEELRGKFYFYKGIRVMPSFHPSLLLEKPELKRHVWNDMKLVMALPEFSHEDS
jgi:DNA polymerase